MSSRALRRLQQDATVVKIKSNREEQNDDDEEEEDEDEAPGFTSRTKRTPTTNPFALLVDDEIDGNEDGVVHDDDDEEEEEEHEDSGINVAISSGGLNDASQSSAKKRKKKKKKSKQKKSGSVERPEENGTEDVDTAIREVNELLGETQTRGDTTAFDSTETVTHRALLSVDRRFLNAENEMRRIFGSRVVRAEAGRHRAHRQVYHRSTALATPQDSWPRMDRPGLSMKIVDSKDGCQYFEFEHSQEYQRVQTRFWEAVETFDPNAIGMVLNAHPYHIDSLLQLSEVCKMSEDVQMAAELIERALYCFECSFHTFFNFASGTCRLSYKKSENRSFFIALFRHLCYIGRRGCHRTALEFCKLLLSIDPAGDPLGVLLMIDYYAIRAGEYQFIINLFREWESHRNLFQLPNFAFSIPLALFHSSQGGNVDEDGKGSSEADVKLQEALITFPSLLFPLLDKCSVTLDPTVMRHSYFSSSKLDTDLKALQLLEKLYIERSHSLWKEPEVLTWLEVNARRAIARVDSNDPLVDDAIIKRQRRYVGTPRNIYRHVIMSDFDNVAATLPRELSETPILMYDPLPPLDSTSSYQRPERAHPSLSGNENPFLLFLRSLLPTFNPQGGPPVAGGGDNPYQNPAARQLHEQLQRAAAERNAQRLEEQQQQGEEAIPPGAEGNPGQPLDLQTTLDRLFQVLQQALDLGHRNREEGENSEEENQ